MGSTSASVFRYGPVGLYLALLLCCDSPAPASPPPPPALFSLLDGSHTGITFQNKLTEGPNTNVMVYEYFYNGGGVATGDFDGNGRPDLYFSANMAPNRLYLNRGELRFEDVTQSARAAGRPGPWKTGVTVVDLNGDGRDDLYLSYSGMLPPAKRRNQLLINQGNDTRGIPTFRDEAARYGLDLPAFTNQTYFFDYDRDGDLDALLLNHHPKSLPVLNVEKTRRLLATPDPDRGLRLYRNEADNFTDVTEAAGLNGSALSYGLGLALSDLDNDGWIDFYVSNDYEAPDYLYYNNGDGTFSERGGERLGHTSHFSMGSDVADVNNDGLPDLYTLDMQPADNRRRKLLVADDNRSKHALNRRSGFTPQHMRNMLHLNRGDGSFAEIGRLAGVAATDWSWSALFADLDNDGWQDLHVTNGYLRDYTNLDFISYMEDFVADRDRLRRSDVLELLREMPASELSNYGYRNRGDGTFADSTAAWGLARASNSNGAITVDLDGDGDLDLVTNNVNQPAFVYRNNGSPHHYLRLRLRPPPGGTIIGSRVTLTTEEGVQLREVFPNRGYLSSGPTTLHFGLGAGTRVQSIRVRWPDGKSQQIDGIAADRVVDLRYAPGPTTEVPDNQVATYFTYRPTAIDHRHETNELADFDRQPLLPKAYSRVGPVMAASDLNGDGLEDVVIGGQDGRAAVFLLDEAGQFTERPVPSPAGEVTAIAPYDFDSDGDLDLYLGYGGYGTLSEGSPAMVDRLLINDGRGNFTAGDGVPQTINTSTGTVAVTELGGTAYVFVGGRVVPGGYPSAPASYLLRWRADGSFEDVTATLAPRLARWGMVTDAEWRDLDRDGSDELIIVGEYLPVTVLTLRAGRFDDVSEDYLPTSPTGHYNTLLIDDLNGDGYADLVVGNEGYNGAYRASSAHPLLLYADDFDRNGQLDPLLLYRLQGMTVPDAHRDELLRQLPGLRTHYPDYASYSATSGADLLKHLGASDSTPLRIEELGTTLFLSDTTGRWQASPLPRQAQYAPVHVITPLDVNADGHRDLLLCGNELRAKLRHGPTDASAGTLLLGNGRGGFTYVPQMQSGLQLSGAVRSVVALHDRLLFGIEGRGVETYRLSAR